MNDSHLPGPSDSYTLLAFEESVIATLIEFRDVDGIKYRITAPLASPEAERYADLGEWTLECAISTVGGEWEHIVFTVPDDTGRANDLMRAWTDEFQRMRG
jgi:hypothetical protein